MTVIFLLSAGTTELLHDLAAILAIIVRQPGASRTAAWMARFTETVE